MQLSIFDAIEAERRRDNGMALAAAAQDSKVPQWSDIAFAAIERVARRQIHVHVDDVLAEGVPQPKHPNAWGSAWLRAIRSGLIQRSGQLKASADPAKNGHSYPVYFSRVFEPGT